MTRKNPRKAFGLLICVFPCSLGQGLRFHYICKEPGLNFFTPPVLLVVGVLFSIVLVVGVGKSNSSAGARAAVLSSLLALPKTSQKS